MGVRVHKHDSKLQFDGDTGRAYHGNAADGVLTEVLGDLEHEADVCRERKNNIARGSERRANKKRLARPHNMQARATVKTTYCVPQPRAR